MVSRGLAAVATAGALAMSMVGCGDEPAAGNGGKHVEVVAAFYPLQFVAERVGGDAVHVTNLAKPGAEPHDLELTPIQVGQISEAVPASSPHAVRPTASAQAAATAARGLLTMPILSAIMTMIVKSA